MTIKINEHNFKIIPKNNDFQNHPSMGKTVKSKILPLIIEMLLKKNIHNFQPTERIWSDFMENENFDFFKKFCLVFKHVLCINPSENGHDFDFLNFFSKMRPVIKNLKQCIF